MIEITKQKTRANGWTESQVKTLLALWDKGLSAAQISRELKTFSRNAILGKIHRLGVPKRPRKIRPARVRVYKPKIKKAKPKIGPRKRKAVVKYHELLTPKTLPDGSFATIMSVRHNMCRWPYGDPTSSEFKFCGRRQAADSAYCDCHHTAAHSRYVRKPTVSRLRSY